MTFRDGPDRLPDNPIISGAERDRLAREHDAARRQQIESRADEQKFAREKFYERKRATEKANTP